MSAESIAARVDRLELPFNEFGVDHYGISKRYLTGAFTALSFFYRSYFRVRCFGIENVPPRGRAMLVGNHSGGIAIDAVMVLVSMFMEMEPPRLAQGMAEKFINKLPFVSLLSSRTGQFTGLPQHARRLLKDDRMLMVFPEGARGLAKLYSERYSLVDFGRGFMRLALETGTPIVPFAFLGAGSAVPTVANLYSLGKLMGAPYVPVTPYVVPMPLPAGLDIHYGERLVFQGTGAEDDEVIEGQVQQVKSAIAELIARGRKQGRRR